LQRFQFFRPIRQLQIGGRKHPEPHALLCRLQHPGPAPVPQKHQRQR
jgi:hypothetical protein